MSENRYFQAALSNFTADFAYTGAVRHLYDLGLSVEEIGKKLTYPASTAQIERVIRDYEAEKASPEGEYTYVQETDAYGHKSFRRVKRTGERPQSN